jgi:hypothetical protein
VTVRAAVAIAVALAMALPARVARAEDAGYREALAPIEAERLRLGLELRAAIDEAGRAAVRARARAVMARAIEEIAFPAWMGTPWGMGPKATARRPHQPGRAVGCSGFVVATLENIGLRFAGRARFIQARALHLQRSLAPAAADLHHVAGAPAEELTASVAALGDGLYLIGMRYHVGFVRVREGRVELIHAGATGSRSVQREELAAAPPVIASRPSGYFVTPLLADDRLVDSWLLGRPVRFQPK